MSEKALYKQKHRRPLPCSPEVVLADEDSAVNWGLVDVEGIKFLTGPAAITFRSASCNIALKIKV